MTVLSGARRGLFALVLPMLVALALGSTQGAAGARPADGTATRDPAWRLDQTFGDRGEAFGPSGAFPSAVVAAGDHIWFTATDDDRSFVGRLTSSGTLDTSVGAGTGYVAVPEHPSSVLIDQQGRIVVVGTDEVQRFSPDLQLDTTFGDGGTSRLPDGSSVGLADAALQPDGKIVVAGDRGGAGSKDAPGRMLAVRLDADGSVDTSFGGGDGMAVVSAGLHPSGTTAVTVTSDAKIVLAGYAGYVNGSLQGSVAQLLPTGAPDPSFGTNGVVAVPGLLVTDVVRLPTGSLAVTGPTGYRDGQAAVRLVQVSDRGRLTAWPGSTSSQRTVVLDDEQEASANALTLQHSGKLVIAGDGSPAGNYPANGYLIVRTLADGRPAPGYAHDGHALVTWLDDNPLSGVGPLNHATATASTVDDDDQIILAGFARTPSGDGAGFTRLAPTSPALAATTELRQTTANGSWYACGKTLSTPCAVPLGAVARFGGRSWPAPTASESGGEDGLRLQVQRTDGSGNTTVTGTATTEGNFRIATTPSSPGHYRARVKVPDSTATLLTAGQWRYFDVS